MQLKPKFARVIIQREVLEASQGGIILPNAKRDAEPEGIVYAVGPTCDETITVGMKVRFGNFAGDWLEIDGMDGDYYICQDEDILCEIED